MSMPGGRNGGGYSWWWLLTPVLVAGLWLGFSHQDAEYVSPPITPVESEQPPVEKPVFSFPAMGEFSQIALRPLFTVTRRPPAPLVETKTEPEKATQPTSLKKYLLTAVVITEDQRLAMFRDTSTGSFFRRAEGGEIDGWLVEEVLPDEVVISNEGVTERLVLRRYKPPPASSRAAKSKAEPDKNGRDVTGQKVSPSKRPRRRLNKEDADGRLTGPEPANIRRPQRPLRKAR